MSSASLTRLETTVDAKVQTEILDELCTMLCIGMEDHVRAFDVEFAVKVFVKVLQTTENDNVVVLCSRAIALVLEMIPRSCRHVVDIGTMPILIKYLSLSENNPELAEEILKSCEKVSVDDPQAIIAAQGAVQAITASMEFTPAHLHKTTVAILSNVCRKSQQKKASPSRGRKHEARPEQDANMLKEVIPALLKLMEQSTSEASREVVERVCTCIANVVDVRGPAPGDAAPNTRVAHLVKAGVLRQLVRPLYQAVKTEQDQKQVGIMLKLLAILCTASPSLVTEFLLCNPSLEPPFLKRLVELMLPDSADYSQVLMLPFRTGGGLFGQTVDPNTGSSSDYIPALLHLLTTMLPSLPPSALCYNHPEMVPQHTWAWEDDYHNFSPYDKNATEALEAAFCRRASNVEIVVRGMKYTVDLDQMKQRNRSSGVARNVIRHAIHSGFRRRCATAPESPSAPSVEFRRVLGGLRAFLGSFDVEEDQTEEKQCLEENKNNPIDANPVEAASLPTTSSHQVYRTSPALAYEWLESVMPALLQLANFTTDSSVRLWCVELLARILHLCVAATKHVQPVSPKPAIRVLKSRLKSDGDWIGLNRRLKNTAFALTGFLGDVVARAECDSIVDHVLYISSLLATVGTRALRQLLQRSGLPTILQSYCNGPEAGPPKSPRSSESARAADLSAVKQRLQQRARCLLERHLAKADSESRDDPQEAAEGQLRQLSAVLLANTDPVSEVDTPDAAGDAIGQLFQLLSATAAMEKVTGSKDSGISTFEFLNSGITEALLGYLTFDAPPSASDAVRLTAAETRGFRLLKFTDHLQTSPKAATTLLHFLQQALSLAEKFPAQPECLFQPAGAANPVLRPSASVREFIRLLHHRVFKVTLVDGEAAEAQPPQDAPTTETEGKVGEAEKGKGKRKRNKKAIGKKAEAAKQKAATQEQVAETKCTTVDPLATVGCVERFVAHALESGQPLGRVCGRPKSGTKAESGEGDDDSEEDDDEEDFGLEFCIGDEDDEFFGEEDEEDDEDEMDDVTPRFAFRLDEGDEMDIEAEIISRLTGSQSSGGHSPKVQAPRLRRERYYLWMKGVGRLPQSATLLHAIANHHLSGQGCADLLMQIDRLFTSPTAAAPTSSRALRELEAQRLGHTIRQQQLHCTRLEEQAEEARVNPPTPTGSKKKKKKSKSGEASRAEELQREAQRLQEQLKHSADRHRQAANRMADRQQRLEREFQELFPPSLACGFPPLRHRVPDNNELWDTVYTIYYTRTPTPPPAIVASMSDSPVSSPTAAEVEHASACAAFSPLDRCLSLAPAVPASFHTALASEALLFQARSTRWMQSGEVAHPILQLMKLLHMADRNNAERSATPVLDRKDFHNHQLTSKLMQALAANAVAVALLGAAGLPTWCRQLTLQYSFLFPYDARKEYLTFTSFGALRSLYTYLMSNAHLRYVRADVQADHALGAIKARVDRHAILRDCDTVLFECADRRAPLDVMYNDEVGTGLGPTLELFTLVSQQLQRKSLGLWRGDDGRSMPPPPTTTSNSTVEDQPACQADKAPSAAVSTIWDLPPSVPEEYLDAKEGLFPCNTGPEPDVAEAGRLAQCFTMVGRFLARALQDGRLLDLHFSPFLFELFSHWAYWVGCPTALAPQHVVRVEAALGRSLQQVLHWALQAANGPLKARQEAATAVRSLGLDFTTPGSPDVSLLPDGEQIGVDETNAAHYVWLVCHELLLRRVRPHIQAILHGFEEALPGGALGIFEAEELEQLWCGHVTDLSAPLWTQEEMAGALVCMHGYTSDSSEIADLLSILCNDFTPRQQQLFLIFLTGSSRLPPGGISAVQPKITVVRKGVAMPQFAGGAEGDSANALPSCNTCFHYLKLPAYGSRSLLKEKLLLAVEEGRGAFSLS
eukprot:GGOE01002776.1.p1 GENE.GGOE01002776.1~~GGOE01002776.1.p1  ORF type:complete len:1892 (-),score=512.93 GGOE01002776.1:169-5844(-)